MVLLHDIVEIDAGDTFLYDQQGNASKAAREQQAAARIFGLLPKAQQDEFTALWREFEERQTADSRFANALDRLMPLLHNYHNQGKPWQAHGITRERVIDMVGHMAEGSTTLWNYALSLINDAVEKGYLATQK
jgi:putative hydrolase of HD superfamily